MKLQALIASMALAFTSGAFGQATPASPATPATPATDAGAAMPATPATPAVSAAEKKGKTTHAKAKAKSKKKLSARKAKGTKVMGAGPAGLETDLEARDRQARIDAAYANWLAQQRR
ncbi:MAG: hypothetical protein HY854_03475 [Burkholderiales bacterium]|nr:hypothetical protein [Burkholderiales bacterium]